MLPLSLVLAFMLAASPGAYAQEQNEQPQEDVDQPQDDVEPPAAAEAPDRQGNGRQAVPRAARPARGRVDRGRAPDRRRTVIVRPPAVYNNYYASPRRPYPYSYWAFGLGYYRDPYRWSPGGYSMYGGPGYRNQYDYGYDIGELRLQIVPRHAQVFVDGYYTGTVDDYDGGFQSLKLESGPYEIRTVAPGFEAMEFDVRITPGQKITYRSELLPRP